MLNKEQLIAEGYNLLSNIQYTNKNEYSTWFGHYEKFRTIDSSKNNQLAKYIWATYICKSKPKYNIKETDIINLARICPDVCPVEQTPLIYWIGLNSPINPNNPGCFHHTFYQPSIDHIIPVLLGGEWQLSNYKIVSNEANRIKNSRFSNKEDLDQWYENMCKTYFSA